jgi:hypothetical protein
MRECEYAIADSATALKCALAEEVLYLFGSLRFKATGWSMLPTVWPGDTLVVERVSPDRVHVGDVVLVGRGGRLCAHRVVSRAEGSGNPHWITQGDAMPALDRPVIESQLLGRVASLVRAGKRIAMPAELSVVERLIARIVRHSFLVARTLVYLHRMVQTPEETVLPCQG